MLWYMLRENISAEHFNDLTGFLFGQGLDLVSHERYTSFVGKGSSVRVCSDKIGFVFTGKALPSGFGSFLLRGVYNHLPAFERLDEDQPGEIEHFRAQFPFLYELQ